MPSRKSVQKWTPTVQKWTQKRLWEENSEAGQPILGAGQQGKSTAVFVEDVTNEEQSKPLPLGFGGIEGCEEMGSHFG